MSVIPINRIRVLTIAVMLSGGGKVFAGDCPVAFNAQQQQYWCWAASDQMAGNYTRAGTYPNQCNAANVASSQGMCGLGGQDCCANYGACNVLCTPQIKTVFPGTQIKSDGPWSFPQASSFFGSPCQPFIFAYRFDSGGTHYRVARGSAENQAGRFLHIDDPNPIYSDAIYILFGDYSSHSNTSWYRIGP